MSNCGHEECKRTSAAQCLHSSAWHIVDADGKIQLVPDNATRQPFRCPVCYGTGQVAVGFYNRPLMWTAGNTYGEPCRSCSGSGVVWSP